MEMDLCKLKIRYYPQILILITSYLIQLKLYLILNIVASHPVFICELKFKKHYMICKFQIVHMSVDIFPNKDIFF